MNGLLGLNIQKIEQLGSGSVYCQILEMMFPNSIKLSKVNWKARNDWQFIANLKLLQIGFQKCGVKKHIEIERLSKAKYQDNLEFAQWFKRFYDLNGGSKQPGYDPVAKRASDVDFSFVDIREHRGSKRPRKDGSLSPSRKLRFAHHLSMKKLDPLQQDFSEIERILGNQMPEKRKLQQIENVVRGARQRASRENHLPKLATEERDLGI